MELKTAVGENIRSVLGVLTMFLGDKLSKIPNYVAISELLLNKLEDGLVQRYSYLFLIPFLTCFKLSIISLNLVSI